MTDFEQCFAENRHILLEGALGERLKREYGTTFDRAIDMGALVRARASRNALTELFSGYARIGAEYHLPFLAATTTRRIDRDRLSRSGYDASLIRDNMEFLKGIRDAAPGKMFAGALVGCCGDAYTGQGALPYEEARAFHSWEAELFARESPDFFMAALMPTVGEVTGMAEALSDTGIPYLIGFIVVRAGTLPDGTPIHDAIERIDNTVKNPPLCYLTNCVHPDVVYDALSKPFNRTETVRKRFLGIQANTSALSFEELDNCAELKTSTPEELAAAIGRVDRLQPLKIFGGCCGTDDRHLRAIAQLIAEK